MLLKIAAALPAKPRLSPFSFLPSAIALALTGLAAPAAWSQTSEAEPLAATSGSLPRVEVRARSASGALRSPSAIGLDLSWKDTPQSLSVLSGQRLRDYQLFTVSDALAAVPGVYVERYETDRASYFSRGFEIVNFQIDGLGLMPAAGSGLEDKADTAVYERIEVLRGAGTLLVGSGNPSATVNYVRKRPFSQARSEATLSLGSWQDKRLELDLSRPLNEGGSVRGRLVVMGQDQASYLDRYRVRKALAYGVLEVDLGPDSSLTLGLSTQKREPRAAMWGALPLLDSDGKRIEFARSASSAPDWSRWDYANHDAFVDLSHSLAGGWQARATLQQVQQSGDGRLLWWYGTPQPGTGLGVKAWPSHYESKRKETSLDLRLSGPWRQWGRQHELVLGLQFGKSKLNDHSTHASSTEEPLPALKDWRGQFPEPAYTSDGGGSDLSHRQRSAYAAARLRPLDELQLMLGANFTSLRIQGSNYGEDQSSEASKTTPYLGAVWALSPTASVYASHTALFRPQSQLGLDLRTLAPVQGSNEELGAKGTWLDGRLSLAAAVFRSRQDNLATEAGAHPTDPTKQLYRGVDTRSQGAELELTAQISSAWSLNAAYTRLNLKNDQGAEVRPNTPRRSAQLGTQWQLSPQLRLGGQWAWHSVVSNPQGLQQPGYGLLDLLASYAFSPAMRLNLNVRNAGNVDYLHFNGADEGYHGAPRSFSASLNWRV